MKSMLKTFLLCAALAVSVAGCAGQGGYSDLRVQEQDDDFIDVSYEAAGALDTQMRRLGLSGASVLATSFVPVNDLETTVAFGQIISEQVASRLSQKGYAMDEVRLRQSLAINEAGEFMLSREIRDLANAHDVSAVLVGTYAEGKSIVLVNTRLISPDTGQVLASYDYQLAKGENTIRLLGNDQQLGGNAEARASVIIVAADFNKLPDLTAAEDLASRTCSRRGQISSLVDRVIEWGRQTSYFRCVDPSIQ
jgi:hypothetical protein